MTRSQHLALKYFSAAVALFGVMTIAGLLSAYYYLNGEFLFGILHFNIAKILHIDTLVIWLLMGFMGAVYWFLPEELGREPVGIAFAEILFYVFCAAVVVVAVVFVTVQYGGSDSIALWFINQGRKYVEAPRWAALGIVLVMAVFAYNVIGTVWAQRRSTGIVTVLIADLAPLLALYLIAFPAMSNMSEDLFWWWWLVHLWVEATWEILIGCIMALALMHLLGTPRRIVETWLYIEVTFVLGTGILGLGHHYFWIGTPYYWLAVGGFFSALEPLPLLGMVVHAVYDAGRHGMVADNRPAFYWLLAEAFGNFLGAGVFGFMITLPQINLYAHGTQWTVSHAHFAFWGAYGCGVLSTVYLALQKARGISYVDGSLWKWAFGILNLGLVGMSSALLVSGFTQAFVERAIGGSTHQAFMAAQDNPGFHEGMIWRFLFGLLFAAGYVLLVYDLLRMGKRSQIPQPAASTA